MKVLTWNVRGLSSPHKRAQIKNIITSYDPNVVVLIETKLKVAKKFTIKSLWGIKSIKWIAKKSYRNSGGILILWNDLRYNIINSNEDSFTVSANFKGNNTTWWLTTIYGPAKRRHRNDFWKELDNLSSHNLQNWILVEDFNVIRWRSESNATSMAKHSMNMFNKFIQRTSLIDPPLTNNLYMWSYLRQKPVCSRLDRFLYTPSWKSTYKTHLQKEHCQESHQITFQ